MDLKQKKITILVGVISITLLLASTVLYFHLKPRHDAIPVYKQVTDDVYKPYFHIGETRYFTKGALYCESLDNIKQYYDHMNARNLPGVIMSLVAGGCYFSSKDKVYAKLDEVIGMFAKVTPHGTEDVSPRWMPVLELIQE